MTRSILVLNGPNLRRLGAREPEIYGDLNYDALVRELSVWASPWAEVDVRQSDDEAQLMAWLHEAVDRGLDVILNPAAFTHYSYALRDAVAQVTSAGGRLIEVHLSNPASREPFRHVSVITAVSTGTIAGFGFDSYRLALEALRNT